MSALTDCTSMTDTHMSPLGSSNLRKMVTTWYQQVFAIDAKYNTQRVSRLPSLGMLYIRRRNQLLREKISRDPDIRTHYLKCRADLLHRCYSENSEPHNLSHLVIDERSTENRTKPKSTQRRSTAESFAFAGVHHVFDQHREPVTMLKFAHNDRSKFCCASLDGVLSICEAICTPPKVTCFLKGHQKGVTAFDWSISNDLIVSSSLDSTIRLWRIHADSKTTCLRVVRDQQKAEVHCCAFLPANNNLVVAGNSQGFLHILNVSTGIYTRGGTSKIGGKVLALACEESGGSLIWAGNDKGVILSFQLESGIGRLSKLQRVQETGAMITSLSWRPWLSKDAPCPGLLVSTACNAVMLHRIADNQGSLSLWRKYPVKHRNHSVKSTFCPQMGACLVATGSEDGAVHLLDSAREGKAAKVNRLHGHATSTLALSFNYDESLLASADYQGLIILWRNQQRHL